MSSFTDQTGRKIKLQKAPKRIISLVPSQTELLVDLGLKENLIGITKFCVHPENLRSEKEIVGGTKQVSYKQIEELKPDIILGNKEENTRKMVGELEKIAPVHLSDVDSVEGAIDLIEIYGELFQVVEKAGEIKNKILKQRKKFGKACLNKAEKPLKIAYFIWRKPWMVAASGTFIDAMIQEQGWENAFADLERYPPVKLADLPDCDRILLSSEPFPFKEKHREEIKAYFDADKIHFVDGEYFSWYGSRLSLAYPYFKILHDKITQ